MTQKALINKGGQASFGIFANGVDDINYLDFDLRNAMDKPRGRLAKQFKFNQFQFISFTCPDLIIGLAIVDLKIASNCFIYIYHPQTNQYDEYSFISPLAINTKIDTQPNSGEAIFKKGANKVEVKASDNPRQRSVLVELASGLKIDAIIDEATNFEPLALCVRAGYQGFHFTQKATALLCHGSVEWQGKRINLKDINALASVDWSAGYMRRETFWNWASLSCTLADGRRLGLNLAAGVVETGFTENALWLDGKLYKIDMVDFQFDRYNHESTWQLRSNDGVVNLRFEPVGQRQEKVNTIVVASNFTQHFGCFFGEININGETILLAGEWGFTEDHYAKW